MTRSRTRKIHRTRCRHPLLALLPFGLAMLGPADAAEPASPPAASAKGLTVALLDLSTASDLMPQKPTPTRPAWRTTFGSERQTPPKPAPGSREALLRALTHVDAVLIQGVQNPRPLRRLFPARHWRIVTSRRTAVSMAGASAIGTGEARPARTAIAVRARRGLRVTARTHTLRLDVTDAGATAESGPAPSATAIRIAEGGRSFWLASIALPRSCTAQDPPCPALRGLDLWRRERRDSGEPALIGGRMTNAAQEARGQAKIQDQTPPKPPGCTDYDIEGDIAWSRVAAESNGVSSEPGKGCIVMLRLGD